MSGLVLIVEDDDALRGALHRYLARKNLTVLDAATCLEGFDILQRYHEEIRVVLADIILPDGQGFELVDCAAGYDPSLGVIIMTGDSSIDNAILALQRGAVDFLLKPFSFEALDSALVRFLNDTDQDAVTVMEDSNHLSANRWRSKFAPGFLGCDHKLMHLFTVLESISDTECSVLITGGTGTGKELIAKAIHLASNRSSKPFVTVNCATTPENLLESELFGHIEGAFIGAHQTRQSRFVQAEGGVIFLDEVADLPLSLQAKLLRVLQEREVTPLGETKPLQVDVRVVSATHKDLEEMVDSGKFREDLLYRLNVIPIEIPPLRERRGDVPLLIQHYIRRSNQRRSRHISGVQDEAMDALIAYDWPGNVRQLENVVERIVLLRSSGEVCLEDIPIKIRESQRPIAGTRNQPLLPANGIDLRDAVEQFENALILQALERTGWNKNRAATILHMNRTTLVEKLKKKGWTEESKVKVA